jgi:hypothetical protein
MGIVNIIIIVILLIVLIWGLNNLFFKTNIIYDIMCDAKAPAQRFDSASATSSSSLFSSNKNVIFAKDIPETSSSNFMLSVWFYIDNWGNNISNEKNILFMAARDNAQTVTQLTSNLSGISNRVTIESSNNIYKNLNIVLDKYENNLFIDIESYLDKPESGNKTIYTRYKIPNISVQKWNNLTLSIDTRTFDVYLDGKLRNSFILHGLYKNQDTSQVKKNIYIGNMQMTGRTTDNNGLNSSFEGFITRIRYEGNAINPQEAYSIYKAGISRSLANSMYNKYRLKVSFLEYNKEKGSITI